MLWSPYLRQRKIAKLEEEQDNNGEGVHSITSFMFIRTCSCEDKEAVTSESFEIYLYYSF